MTELKETSIKPNELWAICPICGGNLELWVDGYEHCDSCDWNTKEDK